MKSTSLRPMRMMGVSLVAWMGWTAHAADINISPVNNIQATINTAVSGDRILLAPGFYNQTFTISGKSLTIEGTGGAAATTISAIGLNTSVVQVNNCPSPGVTFRGVTIQDGSTPGTAGSPDGFPNDGGGIVVNNSLLTVESCTFTNNHAGDDGGAIYTLNGGATITGSSFLNNTAGGAGGALLIRGGMNLDGCTFSGNVAPGAGGAIYTITTAASTITNSTFSGNSSTNSTSGGAIYAATGGNMTLVDCSFTSNSSASFGGAIGTPAYSTATAFDLTRCTFTGNTASASGGDGGAILVSSFVNLSLTDCVFTRNSAADLGGAVLKTGTSGSVTADRCGFFANSALRGGGIYSTTAATISNGVMVGNTGSAFGGAFYSTGTGVNSLSAINCTIVGNQGAEPVVAGSAANLKGCLIWGNANTVLNSIHTVTYSNVEQALGVRSGAGNINDAPLFTQMPSAGLDGNWGTLDDDYGNLALLAGSPGIDAGDSPAVLSTALDYIGNDRNVDDPSVPNSGVPAWALNVDMGAFEFQLPATSGGCVADVDDGTGTGTKDGGVTIDDLLYFLVRFNSGC